MKISKTTLTLLVILLLIWVVNRSSVNLRMKAVETAKPALEASSKAARKTASLLGSKNPDVIKEQKLIANLKILEARLAHTEELSLENERLRKLLDFHERQDYESMPAEVIGNDPSNWASIVYINVGSDQGIKPGAGVTTDYGVAGKVIESAKTVSKVVLINDPDSKIAALVQRTREKGLVAGTLGRTCRMVYISVDADVKLGDMVVSAGSGENFPAGLLIGKIVDLFEDKGGLYRAAIIKPAADLEKLEEVLCVK